MLRGVTLRTAWLQRQVLYVQPEPGTQRTCKKDEFRHIYPVGCLCRNVASCATAKICPNFYIEVTDL